MASPPPPSPSGAARDLVGVLGNGVKGGLVDTLLGFFDSLLQGGYVAAELLDKMRVLCVRARETQGPQEARKGTEREGY